MPIYGVPTEIDQKILHYLNGDNGTLCAMSRVSKYYGREAERVLYRNISFNGNDGWRVKSVLIAYLNQPNRAKFTKNFVFSGSQPSPPLVKFIDKHTAVVQMSKMATIHPVLEELADEVTNAVQQRTRLFNHNVVPHLITDICTDFRGFSGALALVLHMAENIERIVLGPCKSLPFEQDELDRSLRYWALVYGHTMGNDLDYTKNPPFAHLKDLRLHPHNAGGSAFRIAPSLKRVEVQNMIMHPMITTDALPHSLRNLNLEDVVLGMENFHKIISSGALRKVHTIRLNTVYDRNSTTGARIGYKDPDRMIEALETHVPDLQVFHCIKTFKDSITPGKLSSFKQLKSLKFSQNFVFPKAAEPFSKVIVDAANFPKSLQKVEIVHADLNILSDLYHAHTDNLTNYVHAVEENTSHINKAGLPNLDRVTVQSLNSFQIPANSWLIGYSHMVFTVVPDALAESGRRIADIYLSCVV